MTLIYVTLAKIADEMRSHYLALDLGDFRNRQFSVPKNPDRPPLSIGGHLELVLHAEPKPGEDWGKLSFDLLLANTATTKDEDDYERQETYYRFRDASPERARRLGDNIVNAVDVYYRPPSRKE